MQTIRITEREPTGFSAVITKTMNEAKHTPGPLHVRSDGTETIVTLHAANGELVAQCQSEDGPRLAHCWNCHDELLEALNFVLSRLAPDGSNGEQCVLYSDALSPKDSDDQTVVEYLREVIARAEGVV